MLPEIPTRTAHRSEAVWVDRICWPPQQAKQSETPLDHDGQIGIMRTARARRDVGMHTPRPFTGQLTVNRSIEISPITHVVDVIEE